MNYEIMIPVRLASKRFPDKPLARINGKSVIQRCVEGCPKTPWVITDSYSRFHKELKNTAFVRKSLDSLFSIRCGTDRLASVVAAFPQIWKTDFIINLQGDNVLYPPDIFDRLVAFAATKPKNAICTVVRPIKGEDKKVIAIMGEGDLVITFFRSTRYMGKFPFPQDFKHHCGIYCYRPETLLEFYATGESQAEWQENLEQMRWIANGREIYAMEYDGEWLDINEPEDIQRAEGVLK
jgi:3-deoxy-manno-octulosonate cytidylyltransferase (CMP-KDO synthetase)